MNKVKNKITDKEKALFYVLYSTQQCHDVYIILTAWKLRHRTLNNSPEVIQLISGSPGFKPRWSCSRNFTPNQ